MKKLLTIAKDSQIKVSSQITEFLEPENVYLPINIENINNMHKKNVKKGELLYQFDDLNIYSPISGKIVGVLNKKQKYFLVIKNDYHEEDLYKGANEFTTVNIKTDFEEKIKCYANFNWQLLDNAKEIVLNGIEDEPYIANKTFLHCYETSEILQMLDMIARTFKLESILICLKENDRESIEAFNKFLGTYPNILIKILPDYYPIGNEILLRDYLKLSSTSVIFSTEKIYDIYSNVIRERVNDTTFVTITGDAINNPQVFKVKIGSLLQEVIKDNIKIKEKKYDLFVNGIMKRTVAQLEDIIITENIRAVYFMKKRSYLKQDCVHCGKCNEVCPLNCNPYLSYITKKDFNMDNCIRCGLCTFICPSYIEIDDILNKKGDK